jgi:hypothetical protein
LRCTNTIPKTPVTLALPRPRPQITDLDFNQNRDQLRDLHTAHLHKSIGEGTHVHMAGYVIQADFAGSETVNCNRGDTEPNVDIHIHLAERRDADLCDSIMAEVSPHSRPVGWSHPQDYFVEGRPIRITGQMFFDSTHVPCENGKPKGGNPARFSVWEIHPVYGIDVCHRSKTLANCKPYRDEDWTPLDVWVAARAEPEEHEQ